MVKSAMLSTQWYRCGCVLAAALSLAACDNPYEIDWSYTASDTVLLYSLSRAEYTGFPSVYDFVGGYAVPIEADGILGSWDVGFVEDDIGGHFLLPGSLAGHDPQAMMLAVPDHSFDGLIQAPAEGYDSAMVALSVGTVYVLRTRSVDDGSGSTCRYSVKLQPLDLDTVRGILRFQYILNPNCGSRDLSP